MYGLAAWVNEHWGQQDRYYATESVSFAIAVRSTLRIASVQLDIPNMIERNLPALTEGIMQLCVYYLHR